MLLRTRSQWFVNYFEPRKQVVSINEIVSSITAVECRVVYGSSPGTLLFLYLQKQHISCKTKELSDIVHYKLVVLTTGNVG